MRWTALAGLLAALLVLSGCPGPTRGPAAAPTPEQVGRALRFAALAPLPPGAVVTRLETEGGIDTRVVLAVRLPDGAAWRAASGLPADGVQQRLANPDGAIVYREVRGDPAGLTVTAFTT
ncbi:hypothetical protein EV188_101796 [Actinomycetospora succinea]|uniref:Lipoprotein n=1 Tax=Actinomycetospora succinea TaxID=663603 RepID=A0A4R6VSF6_9PSEU|nr:hypothetical protein [Actinomycetospora succinea]TDQ65544.1 hypothetical protein EV188_101796 [Actinomycetospora succinea]